MPYGERKESVRQYYFSVRVGPRQGSRSAVLGGVDGEDREREGKFHAFPG